MALCFTVVPKNQIQKPMQKVKTFDLSCVTAQQNALLAKNRCISSCWFCSRLFPLDLHDVLILNSFVLWRLQHISATQELFEERSLETKWFCDGLHFYCNDHPTFTNFCTVTHIRISHQEMKITQQLNEMSKPTSVVIFTKGTVSRISPCCKQMTLEDLAGRFFSLNSQKVLGTFTKPCGWIWQNPKLSWTHAWVEHVERQGP